MNRLLRRTLWAGAALSAAVAALPAVQASATDLVPAKPPAVAGAAANAPGLAKRHKTEYPTVAGAHAKRLRHAAAGAAATGGNLAYGGAMDGIGVTTGPPKVYLVFWGSQWGTASGTNPVTFSGDPKAIASPLQKMFAGLGTNNELWSGVMTQFCEGVAKGATTCPAASAHVGYPTGGALAGVWADPSVAAPAQATDHQIAVEAVAAAGHFGNTTAASNRSAQYVIVSPTGTKPGGFNTASGNFCAWHDWNGDTTLAGGAATSPYGDIAFTNMPYVPDAGSSCGANYVNAGTAGLIDGVTMVEGHEYAETVTDQNPAGGWTDSTGSENADKCSWNGTGGTTGSQNVVFSTGTFPMQATWSNDVSGCQIAHAIVTNGTVTNDFSIAASPTSATVAAGGSASATISTATTSGSAQTVALTVSGAPAGVTATLSPTSVTSGASSTLSIATASSTTPGTYSLTVTGTATSGTKTATVSLTVGAAGTCPSPGQKILNPGFESGATSWTATAGTIGAFTGQPAHSGSNNLWLDGFGTAKTESATQSITIPAGCTNYTLSFWLHIDTAETTTTTAYDKLTVSLGSTTLATYSNLNKATGYVQKSFNVSSLKGQTLTLKFNGVEDSSLQTSFVIDDTALTVS